MTLPVSVIIILIGLLVFFGHYLHGIFERHSIPDVLGLMLIGMLLGPISKIIDPNDFGQFGPVFSNFVLIFILFESGTDLRIDQIKATFANTAGLTFFGFLTTTLSLSYLCWLVFHLNPLSCLFIGSALGGTSSAVVVGLVRKLKVSESVSTTLIMESAETDVFTLAIPLSILGLMTDMEMSAGLVLSQFFSALVMAVLIGMGGAFLWSFILNKSPKLKLTKFSTPAFLFILYGIAEYLSFSGPLTALSFGIAIGNLKYLEPKFVERLIPNQRIVLPRSERVFFGELIFLLRIFFFIFIGISIRIDRIDWLINGAFITAALIFVRIFLIRIIRPRNEPLMDKATLSIMIPKGLGAAVIATLPMQSGLPDGPIIQAVGFSIILFSTLYCVLLFFLLRTGASLPFYRFVFGKDKTVKTE